MPNRDGVLDDGGLDFAEMGDAEMRAAARKDAGDSTEQTRTSGPSAVSPPSPSTAVVIEPLLRRSGGAPTNRQATAGPPEEHPARDA